MGESFINVLQVSLGMSLVIAILWIILPVVRKRYGGKWCYWVWLMMGIRLLLPFHMPLPFQIEPYQVARISQFLKMQISHTDSLTNEGEEVNQFFENQEEEETGNSVEYRTPVRSEHTENIRTIESVSEEEIIQPVETQSSISNGMMSLKDISQKFWDIARYVVIAYIWCVGMVGFAIWHILSYHRFKKEAKRWQITLTEEEEALFKTVQEELGIKRTVQFIKSKKVTTPLMMGYLNPMVILCDYPYDTESLYFILKHELMHYQRKDLWYKLLILIVRAVHWFNPLVHLMGVQADQELEVGCDACVMEQEDSERKKLYMQTILQIAESKSKNPMSFTTAFKSEKHTLMYRFESIVDDQTKKKGILSMVLVMLITLSCSGCFNGGQTSSEEVSGMAQQEGKETNKNEGAIVEANVEKLETENVAAENKGTLVASMEDYSVEIPDTWEIRTSDSEENSLEATYKYLSFYKQGEQIGEVYLYEGIAGEDGTITLGKGQVSKLFDRWNKSFKQTNIGNEYVMQTDYTKDDVFCYSGYEWISMNKMNEYYCFMLYLDRQQVSEDEAQKIVESFQLPTYSENAPPQRREALSLKEESQNAVYKISYDTGLVFYYNEELLERFMTSLETHQQDTLEIVVYRENQNEEIVISEWNTLVTDGHQAYMYSYENMNDGTYRYVGKPITFDYLVKNQRDYTTSYRLGYKGESETTRVLELTQNYIQGMTILNKAEQPIYEEYQKTKNEALLKEVSPITIAKYYVQAELDSDFATQYALMEEYKPSMIGWSKEEHLQDSQENDTPESKEVVLKTFGNLEKGEFVQKDEKYGYITFSKYAEELGEEWEMGFSLNKNEAGIWKVCFMPIQ